MYHHANTLVTWIVGKTGLTTSLLNLTLDQQVKTTLFSPLFTSFTSFSSFLSQRFPDLCPLPGQSATPATSLITLFHLQDPSLSPPRISYEPLPCLFAISSTGSGGMSHGYNCLFEPPPTVWRVSLVLTSVSGRQSLFFYLSKVVTATSQNFRFIVHRYQELTKSLITSMRLPQYDRVRLGYPATPTVSVSPSL